MRTATISLLAVIAIALWSFAPKPGLTVTSSAFTANGMIPAQYSCEGGESSPPFMASNIPSNTQTLALILHDPDAPMPGGFTHWVMWNIDATGNVPENFKGAMQGMNSGKKNGYAGMCPPTGTHHYHFMVYALDTKLDLPPTTDKKALEKAIKGHILAQGDLIGLYKKMK